MLAKLYVVFGVLAILGYGSSQVRGAILGGTDAPPIAQVAQGEGGPRGRGFGGVFFIGGGK